MHLSLKDLVLKYKEKKEQDRLPLREVQYLTVNKGTKLTISVLFPIQEVKLKKEEGYILHQGVDLVVKEIDFWVIRKNSSKF